MRLRQNNAVYVGLVCVFIMVLVFAAPPRDAEHDQHIIITEGSSGEKIAQRLADENIVYSPTLFRLAVLLQGGSRDMKAGNYLFEEPQGVWSVAWRVIHGVFGVPQVTVRLPEGSTRVQMADILDGQLALFDKDKFLELTEAKEGYLFPDTYFFFQGATAEDVATRLEKTFEERVAVLEDAFLESDYTRDEIVTLASIIEREVHDPADQRLVSGVLHNRLDIGMALQADATLYYLLGKPSSELTQEDLETDSPYNTYRYPGLPPGPISNPGLEAMKAALEPTPSEYYYYLSDEDGVTYYAETFEEHIQNKARHL